MPDWPQADANLEQNVGSDQRRGAAPLRRRRTGPGQMGERYSHRHDQPVLGEAISPIQQLKAFEG